MQNLAVQYRIYLLKLERHAHHRHTVVDCLVHAVPTAVGHQRTHIAVTQDILQAAAHTRVQEVKQTT